VAATTTAAGDHDPAARNDDEFATSTAANHTVSGRLRTNPFI
jgi:hypothetical protein